MATSTVDVIPTNAALGADVTGFDINAMTEADFAALRAAWMAHLVLRVRGQNFDRAPLVELRFRWEIYRPRVDAYVRRTIDPDGIPYREIV